MQQLEEAASENQYNSHHSICSLSHFIPPYLIYWYREYQMCIYVRLPTAFLDNFSLCGSENREYQDVRRGCPMSLPGVTWSDPCVHVLRFPPFMVDDWQEHGRDCSPAGSLNAAWPCSFKGCMFPSSSGSFQYFQWQFSLSQGETQLQAAA